MSAQFKKWRGKVVTAVQPIRITRRRIMGEEETVDAVELVLGDIPGAKKYRITLDQDCCSGSYFTDVKQFNELLGSAIQEVEERDGEVKGEHGASVEKWHFLVFITSHGHVTIDWRNESNGYYDGTVVVSEEG